MLSAADAQTSEPIWTLSLMRHTQSLSNCLNFAFEIYPGTSLVVQVFRSPSANVGDMGLLPGSGRFHKLWN